MTTQPPLGEEQQPPPMSKRDAKAQAAAAAAYSKSQRNWFARHKLLTGIGALVVIIFAIVTATSGGSGPTGPSATADAGTTRTTSVGAAGIGTPVRDGKFEFTVTAVDPGKSTIGTAPVSATAQGQFVLVHLSVKNIGGEQQLFDETSQKMIDQQGRQLSSDSSAAIYVDSANFFTQINPGNSIKGVVVFDVPKDAVPTTLELHDSAFSGGVTVRLN